MLLTDDILEILKDQLQKTNDNIAVLEKRNLKFKKEFKNIFSKQNYMKQISYHIKVNG